MFSQENSIPDPWKTVVTRTPEELEALVRRRTAALRSASARLLRVQDEERRRLARELHDSTGQILTALKIQLAMALSLESPARPSPTFTDTSTWLSRDLEGRTSRRTLLAKRCTVMPRSEALVVSTTRPGAPKSV